MKANNDRKMLSGKLMPYKHVLTRKKSVNNAELKVALETVADDIGAR